MPKCIIISFFFVWFCSNVNAADTTSVKVYFEHNSFTLSQEAKQILDDVNPNDSSIVLKNIRIHGYSDSSEIDNGNYSLSYQRAKVVKQYLIEKNILPSIITEAKGNGKIRFEKSTNSASSLQRMVIVLIDYEAKPIEETIIIKSKRKKTDE